MITALKTYLVTCDECGEQVLMHEMMSTTLPDGWGCIRVEKRDRHGRGHRDYCDTCLRKLKKKMNGRGINHLCQDCFKEDLVISMEGVDVSAAENSGPR